MCNGSNTIQIKYITNQILQTMIRKSIRKYADRPVSDELLNDLLQQAERTQTMGNLQLYSVVVTRSEAKKKNWLRHTSISPW